MHSRSRAMVQMALAKIKNIETIDMLNIPRYETKTNDKEEQQKAMQGLKQLESKPVVIKPVEIQPAANTHDALTDQEVHIEDQNYKINDDQITETTTKHLLKYNSNSDHTISDHTSSEQDSIASSDDEYVEDKEEQNLQFREKITKEVNKTEDIKEVLIKTVLKDNAGRVVRSKGHSCMYCHKIMVNLPRHYETVHSSEMEVAKLLSMPKKSTSRRNGFIDLARIGDYYHNVEVLSKKAGELILVRRPSPGEDVSFKEYSPCPYCLGFMLKKHIWHHVKHSCSVKKERNSHENHDKEHRSVLAESRALLFSSLNTDQPSVFVESILKHMRDDKIAEVCREDPLILKLGMLQFQKYGKTQGELIRQQMRQVGRLMLALKELAQTENENNQSNNLKDWLKPGKFDSIVSAVKLVCLGKDPNSFTDRPEFQIPSLALKLGHSLRKCIGIERGTALRTCNKTRNEELKDLLNLIELEWAVKISSNALATLYKRKLNQTNVLPLTSDLVKLNQYIKKQINLVKNEKILNWTYLAELSLCRLILFNKRRSGEASRLRLETYLSSIKNGSQCSEDLKLTLTDVEKKLITRMGLIEIIGKRGKKVPIIVTPDIRENIEVLITSRKEAGINEGNEFVFARLCGLNHIRGHDCLSKLSREANVESPHLITSTNLRKYIATVVQIFDMTENETDWLARHLGHDVRIHREFYRTHESVVETAKISRILLAVEQGKAHLFKGKKLEDINIDDLKVTDDESDNSSGNDSCEEVNSHINHSSSNKSSHVNRPTELQELTEIAIEAKPSTSIKEDICTGKKKQKRRKTAKSSMRVNSESEDSEIDNPEDISQFGGIKKKYRKHLTEQTRYHLESIDSQIQNKASTEPVYSKAKVVKRPWSNAEREATLEYFRILIRNGTVPRKNNCEDCIKSSNGALENRTWKEVKYFVHNHLAKIKKDKFIVTV